MLLVLRGLRYVLVLECIQVHFRSCSTVRQLVSRTQEATLRVRDILARRCASVALQIQRVSTPALAAVLNTSPLVHVALAQADLDGHVVSVVELLAVHEAAGRGLLNARVVGEIGVAFVDGWLRGGG